MSILDNASAIFAKHRTAVLAAGGAGVVGLAVITRSRRTAAAGGGGADGNAAPQQVGAPADPYSSVAYDVYDALQPQLESAQANATAGDAHLQAEIAALQKANRTLSGRITKILKKKKKKPAPAPHKQKRRVPKKSPKKPIRRRRRPAPPVRSTPPSHRL